MRSGDKSHRDGRGDELTIVRSVLSAPGGQPRVAEVYGLVGAAEAARFLGLAEATVRDMTYRRELPCVKVGPRGVRYQMLDLIRWIEQHKRPVRS